MIGETISHYPPVLGFPSGRQTYLGQGLVEDLIIALMLATAGKPVDQ